MSNTISPHHNLANFTDDHSNTPAVYDGAGYNAREFDSHSREGFVVFVDFLGIKGIWRRMKPEVAFSSLKRIISDFDTSLRNSDLNKYSPYFMTLSDTIIVTCMCPKEMLGSIFNFLIDPFIRSLEMGFPLRGSISYGSYFISTRLVIGPALDEAVSAHNQLEIIGICTTKTLSDDFNNSLETDKNSSFCYYRKIPTKEGHYDGFMLDWRNNGSKLLIYLQEQLKKQTDKKVGLKYENTINFYNAGI